MRGIPALVLLSAAAALGIFLGVEYLRGRRVKPALIGTHLLLGTGGLEVLAMMLRGAPDGGLMTGRTLGTCAAAVLALALMVGITVPLIGPGSRRRMNAVLGAHVGIAAAGIVLLVAWVLQTMR